MKFVTMKVSDQRFQMGCIILFNEFPQQKMKPLSLKATDAGLQLLLKQCEQGFRLYLVGVELAASQALG